MSGSLLTEEFFQRDPLQCAQALIGQELYWDGCSGIIVETEAYLEFGDEACHAFTRPSTRTFIADNPPGTAYVYLNYGVHWLINVLVKNRRRNGIILIRALEPLAGVDIMRRRRKQQHTQSLCSGPGKLTQALGIDGSDHGRSLCDSPHRGIIKGKKVPKKQLVSGSRIGISRAVDLPWRFYLRDCPHVSR